MTGRKAPILGSHPRLGGRPGPVVRAPEGSGAGSSRCRGSAGSPLRPCVGCRDDRRWRLANRTTGPGAARAPVDALRVRRRLNGRSRPGQGRRLLGGHTPDRSTRRAGGLRREGRPDRRRVLALRSRRRSTARREHSTANRGDISSLSRSRRLGRVLRFFSGLLLDSNSLELEEQYTGTSGVVIAPRLSGSSWMRATASKAGTSAPRCRTAMLTTAAFSSTARQPSSASGMANTASAPRRVRGCAVGIARAAEPPGMFPARRPRSRAPTWSRCSPRCRT